MLARVELFDPHYDKSDFLKPNLAKLDLLSRRFRETVEDGSCYLPESAKAYEVLVFVFDGEEVVGFSAAKSYADGEEWILTASFLEEGYRGKHLGSEMAKRLISEARKRGVKVITVQTKNERMIRCFQEEGFRITSRRGHSCNLSFVLREIDS